jgi:hypothetical protein
METKSKPMIVLEPIDFNQCQGEKQVGAFALGGQIGKRTRCTRTPRWLAVEINPKDGVRGGMTLCEECKEICIEVMGADFATYQKIKGR